MVEKPADSRQRIAAWTAWNGVGDSPRKASKSWSSGSVTRRSYQDGHFFFGLPFGFAFALAGAAFLAFTGGAAAAFFAGFAGFAGFSGTGLPFFAGGAAAFGAAAATAFL